jgi:hypothetical protein
VYQPDQRGQVPKKLTNGEIEVTVTTVHATMTPSAAANGGQRSSASPWRRRVSPVGAFSGRSQRSTVTASASATAVCSRTRSVSCLGSSNDS